MKKLMIFIVGLVMACSVQAENMGLLFYQNLPRFFKPVVPIKFSVTQKTYSNYAKKILKVLDEPGDFAEDVYEITEKLFSLTSRWFLQSGKVNYSSWIRFEIDAKSGDILYTNSKGKGVRILKSDSGYEFKDPALAEITFLGSRKVSNGVLELNLSNNSKYTFNGELESYYEKGKVTSTSNYTNNYITNYQDEFVQWIYDWKNEILVSENLKSKNLVRSRIEKKLEGNRTTIVEYQTGQVKETTITVLQ